MLNQKSKVPVLIFREGKHFIVYSSFWICQLLAKGTFRDALKELGWKKIKQRWQSPSLIAQEYVSINTPSLEKV